MLDPSDTNPVVAGQSEEEFLSEIKEPDLEAWKRLLAVAGGTTQTGSDLHSTGSVSHVPGAQDEAPRTSVLTRSMLPAFSIFDTASGSRSSMEERSVSAQHIYENVPQPSANQRYAQPADHVYENVSRPIANQKDPQPAEHVYENVPRPAAKKEEARPTPGPDKPKEPVYEAVICQRAAREEPIENAVAPAQQKVESTQPIRQIWSPERGGDSAFVGQVTESATAQDRRAAGQPIREGEVSHPKTEATSRPIGADRRLQASPRGRRRERTPPSGHVTGISSIESIQEQERKKILDFEDLYTYRDVGQLVGIGAISKVSTFASPALETGTRQTDAAPGKDGKSGKGPSLVLKNSDVISSLPNGKEASQKRKAPSPPREKKGKESPANGKQAASPEAANAMKASTTPVANEKKPVMTSANDRTSSRPAATGKSSEHVYEAVICRAADGQEPIGRPQDLYGADDGGDDLDAPAETQPPRDADDNQSKTFPRKTHKSQGE